MILAFYNIAIFDKYLGFLSQAFEPAPSPLPRIFDYRVPSLQADSSNKSTECVTKTPIR